MWLQLGAGEIGAIRRAGKCCVSRHNAESKALGLPLLPLIEPSRRTIRYIAMSVELRTLGCGTRCLSERPVRPPIFRSGRCLSHTIVDLWDRHQFGVFSQVFAAHVECKGIDQILGETLAPETPSTDRTAWVSWSKSVDS